MFTLRSRQQIRQMQQTRRPRRGRLAVRTNRKPNHMGIMLTVVVSCLLLICFLIYDLVTIYQFFSDLNTTLNDDIIYQQDTTQQFNENEDMGQEELIKTIQSYQRQRPLAAALVVLMILQLLSGVAVYVGFEKKIKKLLLGYLVLTFPVMTFAMIYAILFMVMESSTVLYVKIASVILVYTIQANIFRMVYRMYQLLKYQSRRGRQTRSAHNYQGYEGNSSTLQPVHIQLKPPPYEKEPPPYELKAPGINPSATHDQSPTYHTSHMTNAISSSFYPPSTVLQQDPHLSPTVHTSGIHNAATAGDSELPSTAEENTRPSSSVSYDIPPPSNTTSVYHIQMTEEGLPPPYSET